MQGHSPLFPWIPKNSPLNSALSGEFSVLYIFYQIIALKGFKNKFDSIQLLFDIIKIIRFKDSDSSPIIQ